MRRSFKPERRFHPARVLAVSFIVAILFGSVILLLPVSTKSGEISLIDALFTSTSAVCVTGLIVQDTPSYFSTFGQVVILILIQLGGLGIMTFSTVILLAAGRRVSIRDRVMIQEGFRGGAQRDFRSLIANVFYFTIAIELVGALSFFLRWHRDFPLLKNIYFSIFHSVSAFCNAGFALFSDSFVSFRKDIWINFTLIILIVLGGLGFFVLQEGKDSLFTAVRRKKIRLSLHTKLVISLTVFLVVFSFILVLLVEGHLSFKDFTAGEKVLATLFQVITPRTAGFNTVDSSVLGSSTVLLLILLMFVGASPGSTGGGVKTSTMGVIFAFIKSKIAGRESVNFFHRTLPQPLIMRALTLVSLGLCLTFILSFVLLLSEPGALVKEVLFEVFSAFGTVGLSLGLTPKLSVIGKGVIIITMFIGRIGPLTLLYALSRQRAKGRYEYVEESVMIG